MQKITDERLIVRNLKNIRIAFIVETLGILILLGYNLVQDGYEQMVANPLWLIFIVTMTVLTLLSININVAYDRRSGSSKKFLSIGLPVLLIISLVITVLVNLTPGYSLTDGLLMGGILLICGLLSIIYAYVVKKREEEE
ncbi:hypothetical protein [Macrococcus brunensis]|uniref:hypothetical protein n=1 Tax=Macrococcus brunensis TaxID=198483 RepID=UPI001EF072DA|nr:hypothetical protein [Macrococcus brunensis]ULG72221.1 hypothetical protein MGG12_01455 [Macrococcus brunensis]